MAGKENAVDGLKAPESFFSQLRHLAGAVDNKVQFVKENLTLKKSFPEPSQDHACANLFLVNTKKELTNQFEQVKAKFTEFDQNNSQFSRMQDLIKSVLIIHEQRSEKLLNYLECYGYIKPASGSNDVDLVNENKSEPSNEDNGLVQNSDESAEDQPEKEIGSISSTPQSKPNIDKQFVRRTPKLEDLYCKLSENTISLLKGAKSHSKDFDFNAIQTSNISALSSFDKARPTEANSTTNSEVKKTVLNETFSSNYSFSVNEKNPDCEDSNTLVLNSHRFADVTLTEMPKGEANSSTKDKYSYGNHLSSINATQTMVKYNEHRKSPVFEDVYGMLSESTISLLRHTYNKSASAENLSERHITEISDSFRDTELQAELNSSMKPNDKSLSESNLYNCTPAMSLSLNKSSNTTSKANATTEDTHALDLSELQQNTFFSEYSKRNPKCARSLLYTGTQPPATETTSNLTSSYPYVSSIGKENLPANKRFDAPSEPPKLLSRALIQDLYNNKY